jgi:hypothetical protein
MRKLRKMGNEGPVARARRLAGVAWAGYSVAVPPPVFRVMRKAFEDGFVRGYEDALRDMVDVDDEHSSWRGSGVTCYVCRLEDCRCGR